MLRGQWIKPLRIVQDVPGGPAPRESQQKTEPVLGRCDNREISLMGQPMLEWLLYNHIRVLELLSQDCTVIRRIYEFYNVCIAVNFCLFSLLSRKHMCSRMCCVNKYNDNVQCNLAYAYATIQPQGTYKYKTFPVAVRHIVWRLRRHESDPSVLAKLASIICIVRNEKQAPTQRVRQHGAWLLPIVHVAQADMALTRGLRCMVTQYDVFDQWFNAATEQIHLHGRARGARPVNSWFVIDWVHQQIRDRLSEGAPLTYGDVCDKWWVTSAGAESWFGDSSLGFFPPLLRFVDLSHPPLQICSPPALYYDSRDSVIDTVGVRTPFIKQALADRPAAFVECRPHLINPRHVYFCGKKTWQAWHQRVRSVFPCHEDVVAHIMSYVGRVHIATRRDDRLYTDGYAYKIDINPPLGKQRSDVLLGEPETTAPSEPETVASSEPEAQAPGEAGVCCDAEGDKS